MKPIRERLTLIRGQMQIMLGAPIEDVIRMARPFPRHQIADFGLIHLPSEMATQILQ